MWTYGLIGGLLALLVSGCVSDAAMPPLSQQVQRGIAGNFAVAVFHGDTNRARAMLVRPDEAALVFLVQRAAAPWRPQHASVQLPARRIGNRWIVGYAGKRSRRHGRFEKESGDLVVFVAPTADGGRVRFFYLASVRRRISTHHDAQLLPSNR